MNEGSLTEGHRENSSVFVGHETGLAAHGSVAYAPGVGQVRLLQGLINSIRVLRRQEAH